MTKFILVFCSRVEMKVSDSRKKRNYSIKRFNEPSTKIKVGVSYKGKGIMHACNLLCYSFSINVKMFTSHIHRYPFFFYFSMFASQMYVDMLVNLYNLTKLELFLQLVS